MRILLTNDDGINADGLLALIEATRGWGEVKVAAPDRERSACGHGMTLRDPLRVRQSILAGVEAFVVSGLPVDCVNVGLTLAWPDGCDLVLAGINNGPNLGFDVTYSGTVAGAMEGAINGIRAFAVSMAVFVSGAPYHYETGVAWMQQNRNLLLDLPHPNGMYYNINVPAIAEPEIQGHRFTRMGERIYVDRVIERADPWGRPYYWQGGATVTNEVMPGSDVEACRQGFVSITPIQVDWTDSAMLSQLQNSMSARAT